MKKISIIVPTWNEEANIIPLVERIEAAVLPKGLAYEIIFVDDHSTDNTQKIITSLINDYPISLHLKKGVKGKASSLLEGFSYARYDLVCMIDADLQYPPEAISGMAEKINKGADIVVACRKEQKTSLKRKIASQAFFLFFCKFLHGFSHDVQSGLKVFKKEILERITLNPTQWSFDLEFLVKAKNAGYKVDTVEIVFQKRRAGEAKIGLIQAAFEAGLAALKLRFARAEVVPFSKAMEEKKGKGFHYKGVEFIHHTDLEPTESAIFRLSTEQILVMIALLFLFVLGLLINWHQTLVILLAVITFLYFADLLFNLFLIHRSFSKTSEIHIKDEEIKKAADYKWPKYTIFCPLYKEWNVLPQFVTAMKRLDYPEDKLQVMLLLEEDDKETIKHAKAFRLPKNFEIIVVPHSKPKTKPKAMNYGLKHAKGEYVVIYDAEDIPESLQLKKAILAFEKLGEKTVCVQAKLNFYNPHQNLLTRVFTAEYSLWFDLVLTGLQSIKAPIPLGGTSNHFRKQDIVELKGWDSFNVTEDCDLGMRLAKQGLKTAIIDSLTLEEANSNTINWFWQRTRWIKGYIQTYLVHMRRPLLFIRNWREPDIFTFQLVVGGKFVSMLINPLMWIITLTYILFRSHVGIFIESFFPPYVLYMGVFCLVFGNFLYMYYYMIGCTKRGYDDIVKYAFLVPFYWLAMSAAAWVSLYKLIQQPHFWAKTKHGLHLSNQKAIEQAKDVIGKELVDHEIKGYQLQPFVLNA